jgi:hypothetical protein
MYLPPVVSSVFTFMSILNNVISSESFTMSVMSGSE